MRVSRWKLSREQIRIILAVTAGNILEWYEIYTYAYMAPTIAQLFFGFESDILNLLFALGIFGVGFITRPLGGIVFGRLGDLLGRRFAFILSIVLLSFLSAATGFLPTYASRGILAPVLLCALRLLQSVIEAGETPATICYLYEFADEHNKRYITSWAGVGNQLGAIVGLVDSWVGDDLTDTIHFNLDWGWRIPFWIGGVIGVVVILLRTRLHESPIFERLKAHGDLDSYETWYSSLMRLWRPITLGIGFGAANATTFYFVASFLPVYYTSILGMSQDVSGYLSISAILISTISIPIFGMLGDVFDSRRMLIYSTVLIALSLIGLLVCIRVLNSEALVAALSVMGAVFVLSSSCITSLLAYHLAHLFPASVRVTGISMSFNIADGIIGGFTPVVALYLLQYSKRPIMFVLFVFASVVVSFLSFRRIREHPHDELF